MLATSELVQAVPLDAILGSVDRVDVIRVDTGGAEAKVLRGAEQTLRRFRPLLFFELRPAALVKFSGTEAVQMLEWLRGLGYYFKVLRQGASALSQPRIGAFQDPASVVAGIEADGADHYHVMACSIRLPQPTREERSSHV